MLVIAGLGAGAVEPRPLDELRTSRPASPEASALGRSAVAVAEFALLVISLLVTTGAVALTPPSWIRSITVTWTAPRVFAKFTVSVPVPVALLAVVIQ